MTTVHMPDKMGTVIIGGLFVTVIIQALILQSGLLRAAFPCHNQSNTFYQMWNSLTTTKNPQGAPIHGFCFLQLLNIPKETGLFCGKVCRLLPQSVKLILMGAKLFRASLAS